MATQKPISTISYNSEAFLKEKLEAWLEAHIIQTYQYICHKGEDGDKDHIHLRIEPNKKLDPMNLAEGLREFVQGNEKPLGVRPFRPSKEEDWFLYAVHDRDYLKLKYGGGDKHEKLPYKWEDIKAPEDYDVEVAFIRAKASLEHTSLGVYKRLKKGETPSSILAEGGNPYLLNAVMRTVSTFDYSKLRAEYEDLSKHYNMLLDAIQEKGLVPEYDEDGKIVLK